MKIEIFNNYLENIIKRYSIPKEWIFSKNKKMEVVDARHMLYYLCSQRNIPVSYIQRYMDMNGYVIGHSSIIHGIKSIEYKVQADTDYKQLIKNLEK
jgi:chromosomal replication initiation ATPase DnaA